MRITMGKIKNNKGFSLIELMIAMVVGLIILLGIVSIFSTSSSLNRTQSGLAVLQENGRYAISRIKQDFEVAGRKHCATLTMPEKFVQRWNQGYEMIAWRVADSVNFTNGFPTVDQAEVDSLIDPDQLPDVVDLSVFNSYPLDPSYFIRGFECEDGSCLPALDTPGADTLFALPDIGTSADERADNTDVITVRYLTGGTRVTSTAGNSLTLEETSPYTSGDAIIADCINTFVTQATWSGTTVNASSNIPDFNLNGDTRVFNFDEEFFNVTYFVGIDEDPNQAGRMISSLYRVENGNVQQLVEGVERFDIFYLAQTQTGHVLRLTADQVQGISGGGDQDGDFIMEGIIGCIKPASLKYLSDLQLANGEGCLWRSIYAIEVHLLLNTVNNSAAVETETFIYTPDSLNRVTPPATLPSGLPRERMYRREFTAIVPVRSYTL